MAGVLVGGTAYAASRAQTPDETYFACVNLATGAMRLIDPLAGHACTTTVGPAQERQISWSRTAGERGPQGPAGPRGEAGEDGDDGQLRRLEDLAGVRCNSGDDTGRVEIHVEPPERGSGIRLICMTDDTVTTPPDATPAPTKPPRPTRPDEPTRPADPLEPAPAPATTPQPPVSAEPTDRPDESGADDEDEAHPDPRPGPAAENPAALAPA